MIIYTYHILIFLFLFVIYLIFNILKIIFWILSNEHFRFELCQRNMIIHINNSQFYSLIDCITFHTNLFRAAWIHFIWMLLNHFTSHIIIKIKNLIPLLRSVLPFETQESV